MSRRVPTCLPKNRDVEKHVSGVCNPLTWCCRLRPDLLPTRLVDGSLSNSAEYESSGARLSGALAHTTPPASTAGAPCQVSTAYEYSTVHLVGNLWRGVQSAQPATVWTGHSSRLGRLDTAPQDADEVDENDAAAEEGGRMMLRRRITA